MATCCEALADLTPSRIALILARSLPPDDSDAAGDRSIVLRVEGRMGVDSAAGGGGALSPNVLMPPDCEGGAGIELDTWNGDKRSGG